MKKAVKVLIILFVIITLSGCNESSPSKTNDKRSTDTKNNIIDFTVDDLSNGDYFEGYLKEARKVKPSEIIAKNVSYVVYQFLYKNEKPDIIWYDNNDQVLEELLYNNDTTKRCIYTDDYQSESLPSENTNGDTIIYRKPFSKYDGDCLYDDQGRVITEFLSSSELYQYSYRSDGNISRETHIEIDYDEEDFDSIHLNYYYDDYIYNPNDLLIKTEHYIAGEENPISYEVFEYNNDNQLSKSYYGRYEDNTIGSIDYYEYK